MFSEESFCPVGIKRPQCTFAKEQTHPVCHALIVPPPRHKTHSYFHSCQLSASDGVTVTACRKLFLALYLPVSLQFIPPSAFPFVCRVTRCSGSQKEPHARAPSPGSLWWGYQLVKGHDRISPAPPSWRNRPLEWEHVSALHTTTDNTDYDCLTYA